MVIYKTKTGIFNKHNLMCLEFYIANRDLNVFVSCTLDIDTVNSFDTKLRDFGYLKDPKKAMFETFFLKDEFNKL